MRSGRTNVIEPWSWDSHWVIPEAEQHNRGTVERHCTLRGRIPGTDRHTEYTNRYHAGKASPHSHSICHTYSLQTVAYRRSDREDTWKTQHEDGLYIRGAKVKLLMQPTWKQATLLFLTHIQICYFISPQAGIHSFIRQKFIGCLLCIRHCFRQWGYCSGTFWRWEERQIKKLY